MSYTTCPCNNPAHWSPDNPFGPELVRHLIALDDDQRRREAVEACLREAADTHGG